MRPLVIVNPLAGRSRPAPAVAELRRAFARHDLAIEIAPTEGPGHATELARQASADTVVAVGGDGTLHEVIQGLDLDRQRLGLIPAGSGNDFAWAHAIPRDVEAAVARVAAGRERRVDLGLCDGVRFHNNLGLGFEAEVNRLSHAVRGVRGPALYFVALVRALARLRPYELDLEWEGGASHGPLLTAALVNGGRVGGAFRLAPAARADDGVLDLLVVGEMGRWRVLNALGPVLGGREPRDERLRRARTTWLRLRAAAPVPVYLDGEYLGERRELEARALPGALRLL